VWRTKDDAYNYHGIRRRWKGLKQFMWWSCFSYDEKGPYHIWEDETPKQKKEAKKWMDEMNARLMPKCKLEWEIDMGMRRLNVRRNVGGPKSKWRFTEKTGKLERKASRGGIN
jgi:hypothetical protein